MVEQVEELGAKLQIEALIELECSLEGEVQVCKPRTNQRVLPKITVCSQLWQLKRAGVKVAVGRPELLTGGYTLATGSGSLDGIVAEARRQVRPVPADPAAAALQTLRRETAANEVGISGSECQHAIDLPTLNQTA